MCDSNVPRQAEQVQNTRKVQGFGQGCPPVPSTLYVLMPVSPFVTTGKRHDEMAEKRLLKRESTPTGQQSNIIKSVLPATD